MGINYTDNAEEHVRRLKKLIEENPNMFSKEIQELLIKEFANFDKEFNYTAEILREVYDELGLIPEDLNVYLAFINLLKEKFDIKDKKIIEVGGGILPRLGKRLCESSSIKNITVYDPELSPIIENTDKLVLVRDKFTEKTDVSGADLIIGLMPCEAILPIIYNATSHNIDFMIWLCEGGVENLHNYDSDDDWTWFVKYCASRSMEATDMGELAEIRLEGYNSPYPVIYNKRMVR